MIQHQYTSILRTTGSPDHILTPIYIEREGESLQRTYHRLPLHALVPAGPLPRQAGQARQHVRLGARAEAEDPLPGQGDAYWGVRGFVGERGSMVGEWVGRPMRASSSRSLGQATPIDDGDTDDTPATPLSKG